MAYQQPYGTYYEPRRKRGLKRIIFGSLGIIANGIGLLVMPILAGVVVMMIAMLSVTPVPSGSDSVTFDASSSSLHFVYVPTTEANSASCTVEDGAGVNWEPEVTTLTATVDGTEYTPVGQLDVTSDQEVTITCAGAGDVAIGEVGVGGTLIALVIGLVIPIVLGLLAIALLVWGIIARVRS
ncbi:MULTISPECIES: hypothetical protein [Brachybacterium]|uniref:Uncharacterized protein n=1 Tax=Brachybacterium alimentarium TaxID=47845 RepID=A0A2A3YM09_9MICO|nr:MULTISPECIES: hypothetical protein [Brachybacterium]PCC34767.1 hypothetical protein CIK71_04270 [Brachybacterium alimentarium]PCC40145.1 hypothetical protein CIK66_05800 [Brachybacterium alimentarium]RCS63628.1 hypothetical protein CIK81_12025 [Brachybacterium sp. JB7]RCS69072.1 hypothetical protein CIK73_07830 [Brachybacterium alimentarium]RCS71409.1 hypothetical protein CIK68_10580 [Brachybacterium alimentarium]